MDGRAHPQARLLIWRVLQHGYYTNSRGEVWMMCANICPTCLRGGKDTIHLFFSCPRLAPRWAQFLQYTTSTALNLGFRTFLFQLLIRAIQRHQRSPTPLIVLAEFLHSISLDCNHYFFRGRQTFTPWVTIWQDTSTHLQHIIHHTSSIHMFKRLTQDQQNLVTILETLD